MHYFLTMLKNDLDYIQIMEKIGEDLGEQIIEKLKDLNISIENEKKFEGIKNSKLHLNLENELVDKLEKQAQVKNISVVELCRKKLSDERQPN